MVEKILLTLNNSMIRFDGNYFNNAPAWHMAIREAAEQNNPFLSPTYKPLLIDSKKMGRFI